MSGVGVGFAAAQLSGARAPDFVLKSLAGENLRLSEYRGEVVLLSFWASWCSDCRAQLADMNRMNNASGQTGLQSLTISMDKDRRDTSETMASLRVNYPVLYDGNLEVSRLYDVESLPIAVLIDREGIVREVIHGYGRDIGAQYLERVQALLTE
jgi:peroxiredoxin